MTLGGNRGVKLGPSAKNMFEVHLGDKYRMHRTLLCIEPYYYNERILLTNDILLHTFSIDIHTQISVKVLTNKSGFGFGSNFLRMNNFSTDHCL